MHLFPVVSLSCGKRYVRVVHGGLDEPVAGVYAVSYRKLCGFCGFALQCAQGLVNPRVHESAVFDFDEPACNAVDEAQHAAASDSESGMVAVAKHLWTWDGWRYRNAAQSRVLSEGGRDAVALELELVVVCDVLPLATGAGCEVWAGRRDSVR